MHQSRKVQWAHQTQYGMFGIDFHHFIEKEINSSNMELSQEFGISLGEVQNIRRQMTKR
jgi:hypothetical protein